MSSTAKKLDVNTNQIINFVEYCKENEPKKLTKDGKVKKTHNNKEAGTSSEVYAFKNKEEIASIMNVLDLKILEASTEEKKQIAYRNKLLFLVGLNIGIRASDIRLLKWSFFFNQNADDELLFKEFYSLQPVKTKKTGKYVKLFFNGAIKRALYDYMTEYPVENIDTYIFMGREGKPITVQQMWNVIKGTAKEAGIEQNIGSHSLRKSFGYWIWHNSEDKNKALILLQTIFSHSSSAVTARYIGIMDDEIKDVFNDLNLGIDFTNEV